MNYRFVTFLLATAFFEQVTTSLVRVTTSYRALELGLSVVWLGIITAAFAILPLVFAVSVGRFIDRGNDVRTARIGGALQVAACAGFSCTDAVLDRAPCLHGAARHRPSDAGHQPAGAVHPAGRAGRHGAHARQLHGRQCGRARRRAHRGCYGSASIPPTEFLFWIGLAVSTLSFASTFMLRSTSPQAARPEGGKPVPVRDIVRLPGIRAIFFVSVVTVAAQDLIVVYLPLLGAERGMAVDAVGMLLAVRAVASMGARLLPAGWTMRSDARRSRIISIVRQRRRLYRSGAAAAAAGDACGDRSRRLFARHFRYRQHRGPARTRSEEARGTANSLRMMGNRVGQFTIPFLAGLIAAATGAAGIFLVIGVSLAASAAAVRYRKSARKPIELAVRVRVATMTTAPGGADRCTRSRSGPAFGWPTRTIGSARRGPFLRRS